MHSLGTDAPLAFSDTIVALATPVGRGALSVVRLAGRDAHVIARAALDRWPAQPRVAALSAVRDADGTLLDQAIAIRYDAPASFTGEDAVELVTHGGAVVPATVVAALIARGARVALPGEFTRRAVLNGKLDILQAEATGDLINATSRASQAVALRQLDGGLSRRVMHLRNDLIALEALIAYDIDFPEEDDGPIAPARIRAATDGVIDSLERLLDTARIGETVREGALVVLAGAPNAGKSSLFNALLGESRAIVTEIPGTTRDAIEAVIDTPLLPLRLVDTAGLREALDPVERLGVGVSESYVARAAVVLACGDSEGSLDAIVERLRGRSSAPILAVRTKADLDPLALREAARGAAALRNGESPLAADAVRDGSDERIAVSAETGVGLEALVQAMVRLAAREWGEVAVDAPLLTHERHRYAIARALDEAREFRARWGAADLPAPVAAVHLREAVSVLEDLIGAVDVEDVLDEVFRRFCVGK